MMEKEAIDIIIIGAGLSGIGAAYYLQRDCPNHSLAILEGRENIGGTWDLFKYPGIRSDSDMFTYGYEFKPWLDEDSLASGDKIINYLKETINEHKIKNKIRLNHRVESLNWSSKTATWTITINHNGQKKIIESRFVLSCNGYYDYKQGYQPKFNNQQAFKGDFIHPQHWPKNYNYQDKKIVVIGSGATAVTLIPNLAKKAAHVTLLQRSPTYVFSMPMQDPVLNFLRRFLPKKWVSSLARSRNLILSKFYYKIMTKYPEKGKKIIRKELDKILSKNIDRKHFTPSYNPWEQRLCLVPDADLFKALNSGKASIKTDEIKQFTNTGIALKSGEEINADTIISATGLNIAIMSGIELTIDNQPVNFGKKMFYRGVLLEGVPNFGFVFGYTNASWTLKVELVSKYVARVINHMHDQKQSIAVPINHTHVKQELFLNLTSSYIKRAEDQIPKQGTERPWRLDQNYSKDKKQLKGIKIDDGILTFSNPC